MPSSSQVLQSDAFGVVVYVPVHFDLSQIEYVAPFLHEFPGSKVFVYKWNGIYDKIKEYYAASAEYAAVGLGVFDFTLRDIVKCILSEPPNRRVVFLLTASMAYAFGEAQRDLLKSVHQAFLDVAGALEVRAEKQRQLGNHSLANEDLSQARTLRSRIFGVSVIGHCMYGCMSCKGNDHKVPVYFTRYVRGNIPYSKEHVTRQFKLSSSPIPVLCAPSTGETTMLLHRDMLDYLKALQDRGVFKFVWKFHPMVYNPKSYDPSVECDVIEKANVEWITQHFDVTREDEPCLLPFLEAFQIVLCDLHSSVPFMASYFAPKTIVCYWNDADYEVPAGRDPQFLANLHVFQTLQELKSLVNSESNIPEPRGDPSFFWTTYGKVDGNEVGRFATLSEWPLKSAISDSTSSTDLTPVYRVIVDQAVNLWAAQLRAAEIRDRDAPVKDEVFNKETKSAMGLNCDVDMLPWPASNQDTAPSQLVLAPTLPATSSTSKDPITIMSFNLWCGAEACYKYGKFAGKVDLEQPERFPDPKMQARLLSAAAQAIIQAKADVVGCQEVASIPRDDRNHEDEIDQGGLGSRISNLEQLAELLSSETHQKWTFVDQGIVTPGKSCRHPWGILTCLAVDEKAKFGIKVRSRQCGTLVWIFNTHLPYKPYQPYQVEVPPIAYEDQQPLHSEAEVCAASKVGRIAQMEQMLEEMDQVLKSDPAVPVFLTGDFNEPSHLDWTNAATIAGYHPMPVRWPCTSILETRGFCDAFRTLHPNPVITPGFTWCTYNEEFGGQRGELPGWFDPHHALPAPRDRADRIDYVMYRRNAEQVRVVSVGLAGNCKSPGASWDHQKDGLLHWALPDNEWVSDHRAVVAQFELKV